MTLSLTFACGSSDRTLPLALGDARPAGIDLTCVRFEEVEEVFRRMARYREFDAAEMSMSNYIVLRSRGDTGLLAIPVFPSRQFRHSCVWVNSASGIERPENLKGKRVGVPSYGMTAAVWIRGFLEDDYDVRPSDLTWFRANAPAPVLPAGVNVTPVGASASLDDMLFNGDLDALIGADIPTSFDGKIVKRLFPDFRSVEADYFRRTGIFPIMHTVVVRSDVLERNPWIARSLYDAFVAAKRQTMAALGDAGELAAAVPWLIAEVEAARALMGSDYWPYGVGANRETLETLVRYCHHQGLASHPVEIDALFAPTTLET